MTRERAPLQQRGHIWAQGPPVSHPWFHPWPDLQDAGSCALVQFLVRRQSFQSFESLATAPYQPWSTLARVICPVPTLGRLVASRFVLFSAPVLVSSVSPAHPRQSVHSS